MTASAKPDHTACMRLALSLARRGYGRTSPNPMVGAVLVKRGRIIGRGWHHRAGEPHAEIEALREAERRGHSPAGATLYVTLEPCSTTGRTPACTEAIVDAGIRRVIVAATDPNPRHAGRGFEVLRAAGIEVETGLLGAAASDLNEAFNHWIVRRTPFVIVKAAMTLDGKIATATGESKWITGPAAREHAMRLRLGADAILVGVNTVLADDPSLTVRLSHPASCQPGLETRFVTPRVKRARAGDDSFARAAKPIRRLVLDSHARTPLNSKLVSDVWAEWTTVFVSRDAPGRRREELARRVRVVTVPDRAARDALARPLRTQPRRRPAASGLDLDWILKQLGRDNVTCLLVEGGGEVNASCLERGLVQRVAFYYAPKILGDAGGRKGVAGPGFGDWPAIVRLRDLRWRRLGADLLLTARTQDRDVAAADHPTK